MRDHVIHGIYKSLYLDIAWWKRIYNNMTTLAPRVFQNATRNFLNQLGDGCSQAKLNLNFFQYCEMNNFFKFVLNVCSVLHSFNWISKLSQKDGPAQMKLSNTNFSRRCIWYGISVFLVKIFWICRRINIFNCTLHSSCSFKIFNFLNSGVRAALYCDFVTIIIARFCN